MTTAKQQALKDMVECKIDISVFQHEKVLIELNNIKNETIVKIDFRCFNGGYHPKRK
jgi:hypothetical protein